MIFRREGGVCVCIYNIVCALQGKPKPNGCDPLFRNLIVVFITIVIIIFFFHVHIIMYRMYTKK